MSKEQRKILELLGKIWEAHPFDTFGELIDSITDLEEIYEVSNEELLRRIEVAIDGEIDKSGFIYCLLENGTIATTDQIFEVGQKDRIIQYSNNKPFLVNYWWEKNHRDEI